MQYEIHAYLKDRGRSPFGRVAGPFSDRLEAERMAVELAKRPDVALPIEIVDLETAIAKTETT